MVLNTKAVAEKILESGKTKTYLIRKTEISRTTFYKYMKGSRVSNYRFVVLLAAELRVPIVTLVQYESTGKFEGSKKSNY